METLGTLPLWIGFNVVVMALIFVDLTVVKAQGGQVSPKAAGVWTGLWIAVSLGFAGYIYTLGGTKEAVTWLTCYVVEYALSVDNLFVFLVIFSFFKVGHKAEHRLLYWGVMGAFILRGSMIFLGTELIHRFEWILYFFGGFLLFTAYKLLFQGGSEEQIDPGNHPVIRFARRVLPVSEHLDGTRFTTRVDGVFKFTPLFLILLVVEASDLLFAVDSIPAVMGFSKDRFIIYTSNVCAILGLRSLFFVVSSLMDKFHYLKVGLGIILGFVGVKLIGETYFHELKEKHEGLLIIGSLSFIALTLTMSILASMLWPPKSAAKAPHA